jgi:hypothetical protein
MKDGESVGGIANHSPFEAAGKFIRVKKGFGECQQKSEEGLEELPEVCVAIFSVLR